MLERILEDPTPCAETAEATAADLWRVARQLSLAIEAANTMARAKWSAIAAEAEAYETLVLRGEEVCMALLWW